MHHKKRKKLSSSFSVDKHAMRYTSCNTEPSPECVMCENTDSGLTHSTTVHDGETAHLLEILDLGRGGKKRTKSTEISCKACVFGFVSCGSTALWQ